MRRRVPVQCIATSPTWDHLCEAERGHLRRLESWISEGIEPQVGTVPMGSEVLERVFFLIDVLFAIPGIALRRIADTVALLTPCFYAWAGEASLMDVFEKVS